MNCFSFFETGNFLSMNWFYTVQVRLSIEDKKLNLEFLIQERLLEAEYKRSIAESSSSFWPSFILGDTLRIVFQNLLLESNEEIVQCSGRVWRILLQVC